MEGEVLPERTPPGLIGTLTGLGAMIKYFERRIFN
jgi:hypothetical protein